MDIIDNNSEAWTALRWELKPVMDQLGQGASIHVDESGEVIIHTGIRFGGDQ